MYANEKVSLGIKQLCQFDMKLKKAVFVNSIDHGCNKTSYMLTWVLCLSS